MTRTVNINDTYIAPDDDTSLEAVVLAHGAALHEQAPPPANWRPCDAQVTTQAHSSDAEGNPLVSITPVNSVVNTADMTDGLNKHIGDVQSAMSVIYEQGNPDRILVVTEVIEEN